RSFRPLLEALEGRSVPPTFTVVNPADSGPGSRRDGVTRANANPNAGGPDQVRFNIPGSGPHTIQLCPPAGPHRSGGGRRLRAGLGHVRPERRRRGPTGWRSAPTPP